MRKGKNIVKKVLSVVTAAALLVSITPVAVLADDAVVETPVINVDFFTDRADISPYINAANHRFNSNGYGMYDAETGQVYEDFVEKTAEVNYGAIRYPAGTIGNLFKWKDSIGDVSERQSIILANNSRASEFPTYGLEEHMAYVEQIGADAIIMVAEASETPQDAADLVEYLNAPNDGSNPGGGVDWAAVRAKNGHPEPYGVTYFEIGNEMDNVEQRYWLSYESANGTNKNYREKYALGDTVTVKNEPARVYGTWVENASTGEGGQEFYSQYAPVAPDSQTIYVNGAAWTEVSSFEGQSATDRVYTFDDATGKITFGDGVNGAIPAKDARIRMDYQHVHAGFEAYYDAMKAIDPSIKVLSCLDTVYEYIADKSKCDGIVKHNYPFSPSATDERTLHDAYMNKAEDLIRNMVTDDATVKMAAGRNDVILATTEYGIIGINTVWTDGDNLNKDEARILSRGLHFASILIAAAQTEKEIMLHQGFTAYSFGGGAGLGSAGNVYNALYAQDPNDPSVTIESAMALAYKMYGNGHGETVLNSFVENNPIIDAEKTGDYDALRVLASKDSDGTLYLMVVNRDPENDITSAIRLGGCTVAGDAAVSVLNAESYASCNTPEHPNDVFITNDTLSLGEGCSAFAYTFPAHSVVTIRMTATESDDPWTATSQAETFDGIALPDSVQKVSQSAELTVDPADAANHCLAITRTGDGKATVKASLSGENVTGNLTPMNGTTRVTFRVRTTSDTSRMNMQVKAGNTTVLNLAIDNGMLMCNSVRRSYLSVNEWHTVEFVIDHKAAQYMMYVDGAYSHSARTYNNASAVGPDNITFDVENTNATFYVDDLLVETMDDTLDITVKAGDVDLNGRVDAADLTRLACHVSRVKELTGSYAVEAGRLTTSEGPGAADLTNLARNVAGIE